MNEIKQTEDTNKLIMPKKHLSWSQLSCWLSNPNRYRKEYFEAGDKLDTKYLRFGKGIAELVEKGLHKTLLPDLVVYDKPEFKIETTVLGVPILSYLDSYDSNKNVFREYKTGKKDKNNKSAWDQAKVIKHGQLVFYATALKHSCGKIPEYCDLDWIETKEKGSQIEEVGGLQNEETIHVTGRIMSFHREFDEREIEKMENLIVKVATEISEAYKAFINEI